MSQSRGTSRGRAPAATAGAPPSGMARPRVIAGLRLVRLVGRGGEGEVWEARSAQGQARALKLIRPDALVEPEEVERRGRWLRAVDHPALVAVRRTGVLAGGGLDGWAFVEMPFLDGPSLEDAPADPAALERLEPLAEALDALHAGVWSGGVPLVHRDVKPANLIAVGDRLVLVDHSTLRDASAGEVTRIGTPVFAAPEVALGRAGTAADVYAFAATAVALRTGARGRALAGLVDAPAALDVPAGLRAALAADPRDRPPTCAAALDPDAPATVVLPAAREARTAGDAAPGVRADAPAAERDEPAAAPLPEPDDRAARPGWEPGSQAAWDGAALAPEWRGAAAWGGEPIHGPVWRWLAVLAVLALAPLGALALGRPLWPDVAGLGAAAAGLHLVAVGLAGGGGALAALAPPLAWAWLLADRAVLAPRRRAYARATLAGALVLGAAGAVWLLLEGEPPLALGAAAGGLAAAAGAVVAARRGGLALQLLLLPVWLLGAVAVAAGALLLSPLALLVGRGRACLRLAWATLSAVAEALRRPMAPPRVLN